MDDQGNGPKRTDPDRSNTFHMLPHTIEDICTQQSISANENTGLFFSPIRHVLPQIPTRNSSLRMAISKQTHREMFNSGLGSKQDSPTRLRHQLDLSCREGNTSGNSDESQDQLPLEVRELIPSWKDSQRAENDHQNQEGPSRDQDHSSPFQQHGRQEQESPVDNNIATSGFHISSSSSTSNIDSFLMTSDHHHLDPHISQYSMSSKDEEEVLGKDFLSKIPGVDMSTGLDRTSPQMSSMTNFNQSPQVSWHAFEFEKGYNSQGSKVVALEQVVQKVNNPLMQSHRQRQQVLPSTRSFEPSPNPIKLKIRRDMSTLEQQQQQLQHSPHPLQQPPRLTPPPSHMSHGQMMLPNHQMPMDFQLHQQQQSKHLRQTHPYMYEAPHYVQNQGPKDYYAGGSNAEAANSSGSAIKNVHFNPDYHDAPSRHSNPYSPGPNLSSMPTFAQDQLQHQHHYHNQQQQIMGQQLQHQQQYQHYQHHVAPPASSAPPRGSAAPLSSVMMVLHGVAPSTTIFDCSSQAQPLQQQSAPSPSSVAARPKTGRAKTNAELKKQLMEKRAGQQMKTSGDGSSIASSPSPSQIEVSSPRSVSSLKSDLSPNSCGQAGGFLEAAMNLNGLEDQQPSNEALGQFVELGEAEMQRLNIVWQLGDLVWARVSGHPWWPGMVTADPTTGQFVKFASRGQRGQYHMHFFGEEQERGWVTESSAINFEGKVAFNEFCQKKIQDNKKDRKVYKIPSQHKKLWEASVRSAEKAFRMSRSERFRCLSTLFLPEYKTKRSGRKQTEETNKRRSRSDRSSSSDKLAKRSKKESDACDLQQVGGPIKGDGERPSGDEGRRQVCESSHIVLPKNVSNQHQAQFTVFCRKRRDSIALENPLWSALDIDAHLWQQWSQLDDETRARFIPMGSDFTYLSRMMQNVEVGSAGCEGLAKPTPPIGKPNGFVAEATNLKNAPSKNLKSEEGRSRKKSNISGAGAPKNSSKQDLGGKLELGGTNPQIIDEVCFVCEKPDLEVVQCTGPCRGLFHEKCIGLPPGLLKPDDGPSGAISPPANEVICPQCRSKTHKCCECGEMLRLMEATTVLCSVTDCGRFYHRACVDIKFFKTPDRLVCPLHSCLTCRVRNKVKDSDLILADEEDLDFYECVRCPAAFHIPGVCLAIGTKYLAGPFVVCNKHFAPTPKTHPLHARFGATWCFSCEKSGGHMLNCESCPAAYHPPCLKIPANPSVLDGWQCPDCIAGVNPLYGDVVWVKFGSYRWWPAQIYWPYEVPQNIADLPHEVGEFPVCFFGSRDYLWLNRRRVFPFRIGDKCSREALRKSGGKVFDKAIREAIATCKALRLDPSSTACATSSVHHPSKNDDANYDEGATGKREKVKRKKAEVKASTKERQARLSKRVRSCQEDAEDRKKDDLEEQVPVEESNINASGNGMKGSDQDVLSPPCKTPQPSSRTFLCPQIEKDLSELRLKLKKKKPVEESPFGKKPFPSLSKSSKKLGREKSLKCVASHLGAPSSVVSTLINRPLLQSTSMPGVHDRVCSWCGLEGQSSEESDDEDEEREDVTVQSNRQAAGEDGDMKNLEANEDCKDMIVGKDEAGGRLSATKKDEGGAEKHREAEAMSSSDMDEENKGDSNNNDLKDHVDGECIEQGPTSSEHEQAEGPGCPREVACKSSVCDGQREFRKRGRLIHCDKVKCSKVYHYKCLRITKMPHGHWMCPLHQCTICGRVSTHQCSKCPNAFCLEHFAHCLSYMDDGSPICTGHPESPPISEELVLAILEEMAISRETEAGHASGSTGHRKSGRVREGAEGKEESKGRSLDDAACFKVKKRKRSLSVSSSSSSSSSLERKKKNSKKVKRKKPAEAKDVSFEKRILPSRTQGPERRFIDEDSDSDKDEDNDDRGDACGEEVRKKEASEDLRVVASRRRRRTKREDSKKDSVEKKIKIVGGAGVAKSPKGEKKKGREEAEATQDRSEMKRLADDTEAGRVCSNNGGEDDGAMIDGSLVSKDEPVKKHKSKKLDKHPREKSKEKKRTKSKGEDAKKAKSLDGGGDHDGDKMVKKSKKKSSDEPVLEEDFKERKKHKHSKTGKRLEAKFQCQIPVPASGLTSATLIESPSSPTSPCAETPPPPSATRELAKVVPPSTMRPSSLPPPSSPDKSPMFDNSDDEFPELVIDVPM